MVFFFSFTNWFINSNIKNLFFYDKVGDGIDANLRKIHGNLCMQKQGARKKFPLTKCMAPELL